MKYDGQSSHGQWPDEWGKPAWHVPTQTTLFSLEERCVTANASGSEAHNLMGGNALTALTIALRGRGCRVYPSDMRLHVQANGLYTYPDVAVVCGMLHLAPGRNDTLLNIF